MFSLDQITENILQLKAALPKDVRLLAAAKTRSLEEVDAAIRAGVDLIGQNYVQEAEAVTDVVAGRVPMHFIGHLQKNKMNKAVSLFDAVETVDSLALAQGLDQRCAAAGERMRVLIEVNSGREPQKFGALPEAVPELAQAIGQMKFLELTGLMTMGPFSDDAEQARPYFKTTRRLFEDLTRANLPGVAMRDLSMGMTASFRVAMDEGANIVRLGTLIFGDRPPRV